MKNSLSQTVAKSLSQQVLVSNLMSKVNSQMSLFLYKSMSLIPCLISLVLCLASTQTMAQWSSSSGNTTTTDKVGIDVTIPQADFHISQNQSVLMGFHLEDVFGLSFSATKLVYRDTANAFRSGYINRNYWNLDSLGENSFGVGRNCRATAANSMAFGNENKAGATNSMAFGYGLLASKPNNLVFGNDLTYFFRYSPIASNSIYFLTNSTVPSITINAGTVSTAGFVGIATDTPGTNLSVNGNMAVSGQIIHPSDVRLKEEITNVEDALRTLSYLQAKTYNYSITPQTKQIGFIAQDVEQVLPNLVQTTNNKLAVDYQQLVPLLINAVNELVAEGQDQQEFINQLVKNKTHE